MCTTDPTATVNCLTLEQGAFPVGYALETVFVALSIAFLVQHYVIAAVGIALAYASAFTYLFALRDAPAAGSPNANSATQDAIRVSIVLGALTLLCLAVSIFSQRLSRGSFTAAWSLRAQFQEQEEAIRRERSLRNELQASRDVVLISQTARGIQELVAGAGPGILPVRCQVRSLISAVLPYFHALTPSSNNPTAFSLHHADLKARCRRFSIAQAAQSR